MWQCGALEGPHLPSKWACFQVRLLIHLWCWPISLLSQKKKKNKKKKRVGPSPQLACHTANNQQLEPNQEPRALRVSFHVGRLPLDSRFNRLVGGPKFEKNESSYLAHTDPIPPISIYIWQV